MEAAVSAWAVVLLVQETAAEVEEQVAEAAIVRQERQHQHPVSVI